MRRLILVGLAGVALLPVSALAADMGAPVYKSAPPPPPPPVYNWTGCFVGAGGGYGMNNVDGQEFANEEVEELDPVVALPQTTTGGRGWLGQVSGGCDYQFSTGSFGNWVVGAFADYEFMDLTGNHASLDLSDSANLKENSAWAVGGRIGYLITPNFLTYWDGGYTQTHFDQATYQFTGVELPGTTYDGWFLGSGFEYSFNWLIPGLFLKTEYRFSSYDAKTVTDTFQGQPIGLSESLHPYVQTVTTQLVYRFNWWGH